MRGVYNYPLFSKTLMSIDAMPEQPEQPEQTTLDSLDIFTPHGFPHCLPCAPPSGGMPLGVSDTKNEKWQEIGHPRVEENTRCHAKGSIIRVAKMTHIKMCIHVHELLYATQVWYLEVSGCHAESRNREV